jgi:hypothetical protein
MHQRGMPLRLKIVLTGGGEAHLTSSREPESVPAAGRIALSTMRYVRGGRSAYAGSGLIITDT